jgi:hypothetical protein
MFGTQIAMSIDDLPGVDTLGKKTGAFGKKATLYSVQCADCAPCQSQFGKQ